MPGLEVGLGPMLPKKIGMRFMKSQARRPGSDLHQFFRTIQIKDEFEALIPESK